MANEVRVIVSAQDKTGPVFTKMRATVAGFAAVAGAALIKFAGDSIKAYRESYKIGQQTNAVLKSTGQVAGISAAGVAKLATAISNKTGIDDEAIQSGENLLLTFTNIRNEAGKGNQIFTQATKIITDMSVALGQDMKSSAIQVGKALNDPIKGVTALQRVGVSFTEKQKDQIKALEKSGHHLKAQKIILHELKKEFGGSAEAAATWGDKLKVAFGNAEENLGKKLMPAVEHLSKWLTKKGVPAMEDFIDSIDEEQIANAADQVGILAKGLGKAAISASKFNKAMTTDKKGKKIGGGLQDAIDEWTQFKAKALDAMDAVATAGAKLGIVPKKFADAVHKMRVKADAELDKAKEHFNNAKIEAKLKADNRDAQKKYRETKKALNDKDLTRERRAKLRAENKQALDKARETQHAIDRIHGKTVRVRIYTTKEISLSTNTGGRAAGGPISHAAEGGPRNGLTLVGERGPELVSLPGGSHVFPNGNSTMSRGGRGGDVHVHVHGSMLGTPTELIRLLVNAKRSGQLDVLFR